MEEKSTQIIETTKEITSQRTKQEKEPLSCFLKAVRETLAILFWMYVLIKVFAFDIDIYLLNKFVPEYAWLLNFKFFILIGIIAFIWLVTKNKYILFWPFYVFFYPLIIFFWKIPSFIFKQKSWVFAFAFIDAIISFFKSIKYSFITSALFLVSLAIIFGFSNKKLLWIAVVIVFAILLITYIHRFILIFKRANIFQFYMKIFSEFREKGFASFELDPSIKNLPTQSHFEDSPNWKVFTDPEKDLC
jgi:hypothetical protein